MNIAGQDIEIQFDHRESEYYMLVPIDNQTLKIAINMFDWNNTTVYGNIYVSLYTKRKHQQRNINNCIMTGLNPIKTAIYGMKAFKEVEDAFLQGYNDRFRVIISCIWTTNSRRDAYYSFLSKRGYRFDNLFNEKVIMRVWEKGEYKI